MQNEAHRCSKKVVQPYNIYYGDLMHNPIQKSIHNHHCGSLGSMRVIHYFFEQRSVRRNAPKTIELLIR